MTVEQEWRGSAEFHDVPLGRFRFRLDRWRGDGDRALVCMCNPSDADGERNDPTIWRLMELLDAFDGFTVVNWEPYVASAPAELHRWRRWAQDADRFDDYRAVRERNLDLIRELAEPAAICIVAWGNLVPDETLTQRVLLAMSLHGARRLYAFGTTGSGAPKHPMARGRHRVPHGVVPIEWKPQGGFVR